MRRTARTTTVDKTSDVADGMSQRQCDCKIISALPEAQTAPPRENGGRGESAREAAEKDKSGSEVGPEVQFADGIVVPSENDKESFCSNDRTEEREPGSDPEFVLANANLTVVELQPQDPSVTPPVATKNPKGVMRRMRFGDNRTFAQIQRVYRAHRLEAAH